MMNVLKLVLGLAGCVISLMGLNIGLAGIPTMGWFGSNEFVLAAGADAYDNIDNHIRFLGGLWFAVGIAFIIGVFKLVFIRKTLINLCLMIAIAALFRFSVMEMNIVFSAAIMPSFVLEIIGFPLLGIWLWKSGEAE